MVVCFFCIVPTTNEREVFVKPHVFLGRFWRTLLRGRT